MKKYIFALCVLASGCVYTDIKAPLDTDVSNTQLGNKIGKSTSCSVLWLVAWGDSSTATAAQNGDIKTITHLDSEFFNILFGLYAENTTIAYGN